MSFLSTGALWLVGLVGPLVLLYILKVRRQRVRVPSVLLWREVQRELAARAPWKRLVLQIPLIVQALALVAIALAAARPTTAGKTLLGDHVAIVVDTSASMGALSAKGSRLDEARRVAHELVDALAPGTEAMILDAGREPRIAMPPDRDVRRMHEALDRLVVREVEGDLGASVALAATRLGQLSGRRRIHVVTDGALARPASLHAVVPIEVVQVGDVTDNAAIVRVDVRNGSDGTSGREQVQAFLLIANQGAAPRDLFVTMKQRGASDTLASRKVVVAPGERLPVVMTWNPAEGDRGSGLVFELSPRDALAVDDVAYARIPPGRKLPVVLAAPTEPSPWLERVLASDPDAEVQRGSLPGALANVPDDALVVLERACPPFVPGGDVWVVAPPSGACFGAKIGAKLERPQITSWDDADPRMRFLALDDVFVESSLALEPESRRQELLRSEQGVLACDASTTARMVTLLGFDVADSDWPYKASFVVFARNLLEAARTHRASAFELAASTGEVVRAHVPLAVRAVEVTEPGAGDGVRRSVEASNGIAILPEVERAGFYHVSWQAPRPGSSLIAVNLVSQDESDLRRRLDREAGADQVVGSPDSVMAPREHGHWLALLALAFILFDLWYFTRRPARVGAPLSSEASP
ncbi:MAG: BatA and WFA domain-containing protein [Deltaproteobacteria bacterium]|nr:BatA and WFA domain-containing protein [Deltaproteobacteria bacterium]